MEQEERRMDPAASESPYVQDLSILTFAGSSFLNRDICRFLFSRESGYISKIKLLTSAANVRTGRRVQQSPSSNVEMGGLVCGV